MTKPLNISNICRFCLSVGPPKMHLISDEMLLTFSQYFSIQIHVIQTLPNHICDDCNTKVDLLTEFRKSVLENEKVLYETISKGFDELLKYFSSIKKKKIKEELETCDKEPIHSDEDSIKVENDINNTNSIEKNVSMDFNQLPNPKSTSGPDEQSRNTVPAFKFKCLTCFELFESQILLLSHYNTQHNEKPKENSLKATIDVETVQGVVTYKCSSCSKAYETKKSINRHIAMGHSDARPFVCKMCGRTYKTAYEIVRHGRAHNGIKLFCSHQCGYSTVYHGALKEHERRHNTTEFKYKCEKCNKGFHVKTWYDQHQNVHSGLKPFVCDICGVAFHMEKYLTTHRSLKHPQSSALKRYVCVHCSLACDSKNALNEHLKEHGMNTEKKFLCDLCGKILSNAEQLKFHKRMHLGEKPYSCSTCNKSFAKKFNLQLHERAHSGEKQHACRCGKRYAQRSTLLRHVARHHGHSDDQKQSKYIKTFSTETIASQEKLST